MSQDSMIGGASVEQVQRLWASTDQDIEGRLAKVFPRKCVQVTARQFIHALMGNEERKTGWKRGEAAGDLGPWRQQAILGRGKWKADDLRDHVREYSLETFAHPAAVLVIDETGFLKQGNRSCGVGRMYTGSVGKVTNCQIGVFMVYASILGQAFIDRQLYMPKEWMNDPARRMAAYVPDGLEFMTKPQMAQMMIGEAIATGVPFSSVAADSVYGSNEMEQQLREAGKSYVLGVASDRLFRHVFRVRPINVKAELIARRVPIDQWVCLSSGEGTKGPRWHRYAYIPNAGQKVGKPADDPSGEWTRGLLIRRNLDGTGQTFFVTWFPKDTPIEKIVEVEGRRWSIEDGFETAKNEFGLDHNETRSHHGWYRHVTLSMLAYAMMSTVRQRANAISASGECIPSSHEEPSLSAAFQQADTTLSSLEAETVAAASGDATSSASFQEGDDALLAKQDVSIHSLSNEEYNTPLLIDESANASSFEAKTPAAPCKEIKIISATSWKARVLIRWSVQEIRRLIYKLSQKAVDAEFTIHWSNWRRHHQAVARLSHRKRTVAMQC